VVADKAELKKFENDFYSKDVNKITVVDNVSVISIGQDLVFHLHIDKIKLFLFYSTIHYR
jgi:hypothetical protein